jgi:hypothetical protein
MLLPIEENKEKEEAIKRILLMSWEIKKDQEVQFVIVRKLRVILNNTSMDDLRE